MLHLAQVVTHDPLGNVELQLLAEQKSDGAWVVTPEAETLFYQKVDNLGKGAFLLLELSSTHSILSARNATVWVLDFVEKYLCHGVTPAFLEQETERAEQWRQSLTLQSQELGRRSLELEARREQIEALEESLKQEKQKLEILATQAQANSSEPTSQSEA